MPPTTAPPRSSSPPADGPCTARPNAATLQRAYPNPFASHSTIPFTLAEQAQVNLTVFDVLGREVAVLVDETLLAGAHETTFDASGWPTGVYIYRLVSGETVLSGQVAHH